MSTSRRSFSTTKHETKPPKIHAPEFFTGGRSAVVLDEYRSFNALALEYVEGRIAKEIPPSTLQQWRPTLNAYGKKAEQVLENAIRALGRDFLYPGFKRSLTPKIKECVLRSLREYRSYPRYEAPSALLQTSDEWFSQQLREFFREFAMRYLFDLTIEQIKGEITQNRYWGQAQYSAETRHAFWPLSVQVIIGKSSGASNPRSEQ